MRQLENNFSTEQTSQSANQQKTGPLKKAELLLAALDIFSFTDYRQFLKAFYETKKQANESYSMSMFIRKAGLGRNSRGYFKMIVDGKRNLSPHSLRRFMDAMGLSGKAALYFENLVYFNQAKNTRDLDYYFQRLCATVDGHESPAFEQLKSQYLYMSHWYFAAIRELAGIEGFQDDCSWIANALKNKITKKQAQEAIDHLLKIGLLTRKRGKLVSTPSETPWQSETFSQSTQKIHSQTMALAQESLVQDDAETRSIQAVTLSCDSEQWPRILQCIQEFSTHLTKACRDQAKSPDSVIQLNFQAFQLTQPPRKAVKPQ